MAHDFQDIILIAFIVLFGDFISMQRKMLTIKVITYFY